MLDVNVFDSMRIGLASPEKIREWSHGEVKKPETINYRTLKPERDGLFCERIFGPTRDFECHCGKYKRVRYKGTVCDRCGVEVTRAKVRRERMGHIELAAPVSHIWYFKGIPSRLGLLLDMSPRALERVLYFASYIVLDPGNTDLKQKDLLTEGQFRLYRDTYGKNAFKVGIGAEAVQILLQNIDLDTLSNELREELHSSNGQKRIRAIRRLEVVEAFRKSGNKPEWMILTVIPVIPPELRPMVQLDGGRFATSDLNDLYRRVINRNNRLNRLLKLRAPDIIVRNEKRMLQEAVDALIDNGRRGRPVTGPGNRPLKSLSDMLKGKQGRFRQNLLGKRVDYSGRSVIVVGPELKLHQCGLPKEMALELFKPFVMKKLSADSGLTIKAAKKKVDRATPEVWGVLEEVIKEHPVLLNRAPTLHRLGIQAFEPVLTEGRALKLHPLACTAYNADFDGDQMAIHLPLSSEAQAEARVLMLAANHILAPKDGKPIIVPTQDMVLGTYYLTTLRPGAKGEGKFFSSPEEALLAYDSGAVHLQAPIFVRFNRDRLPPDITNDDFLIVSSSVGRLIFNHILPLNLRHFQLINDSWSLGAVMNKKALAKLVADCFANFGATATAEVIDAVKRLGYHYACRAGMTVAVSDCLVPPVKGAILQATGVQVKRVALNYKRGLITERERYDKVVELWNAATERVADAMMSNMDAFNPIYMMADSGARGNKQQMRQLSGMRGLMADPSGKIIEEPITANFREGLSVSDYFISSHGARKGLADTALRTADSGYLTRRLVDVAQDVIVRSADCDERMVNLLFIRAAMADDTFDALEILSDYLIGKTLADDTVLDADCLIRLGEQNAKHVILKNGDVISLGTDDKNATRHSLLGEFIGKELARDVVSAVVVNGESSVSSAGFVNGESSVSSAGFVNGESSCRLASGVVNGESSCRLASGVVNGESSCRLASGVVNGESSVSSANFVIPAGTLLTADILQQLIACEHLSEFFIKQGHVRGICVEAISESGGVIEPLHERIIGRTLAQDIFDGQSLIARRDQTIDKKLADKICAVTDKVFIRSVLTCKSPSGVCQKCYGQDLANLSPVEIGEAVGIIAAQSIGEPGTQLTMRTFHTGGVAGGDITQGLPRVEELFEARKPKLSAIISEITGTVSFGPPDKNNLKTIVVTPSDPANQLPREYTIPFGVSLRVHEGALVHSGDSLTDGPKNPHDILRICGLKETYRYLVKEVQKVYKSQGVEINDKHIEVMVRQMLHKVKIEDSGSTEFLPGEFVDMNVFENTNTKAIEEGRMPAVAKPILLGITKASLATDSFLSAASFQETTRVLTDAAIKGKVDPLIGLKENVIIGKLIPAGTGMARYRELTVVDKEAVAEAEAAAE